jgi:hypothetical protein
MEEVDILNRDTIMKQLQGKTVVIVESIAYNQNVIEGIVESLGCNSSVFANGN